MPRDKTITTQTPMKTVVHLFEEIARRYATEFHAEAQKTNNDALYEESKNLYAKYLDFFPSTSSIPEEMSIILAPVTFKASSRSKT